VSETPESNSRRGRAETVVWLIMRARARARARRTEGHPFDLPCVSYCGWPSSYESPERHGYSITIAITITSCLYLVSARRPLERSRILPELERHSITSFQAHGMTSKLCVST